jgi:maltooligosyltrehalose trehalohydrolase
MQDRSQRAPTRDFRFGAQVRADGVEFRVWAPGAPAVAVVFEGRRLHGEVALAAGADGFFSGIARDAEAGDLYRFRLDDGPPLPDPASRFQPEGPHGPSEIIDPGAFAWSDRDWRGIEPGREVIYEMHVGTFTADGTWRAAARELPRLAELGITLVEVMPVAEFAGAFGWGYDGVDAFAPHHCYGRPDDLRAFVDAAHAHGIGVLVDVVYNHFGPSGNYLSLFSPDWIGRHKSEWGDAPNYDGPDCAPVRAFFAQNAAYWIDEFHADGLRFDATQQILDESDEHVMRAIVRSARAAAGARRVFLAAENEVQDADLVRPPPQGVGCDAVWNDDFHHALIVALGGRADAYYSDYRGDAAEIVAALRHGFLYQGQRSAWIDKPRGSPALDLAPSRFVHYLENHDQVANSVRGERIAARFAPAAVRAATALLLLSPQVPLLFQGQEYASPQPFLYFADHERELATAVRNGRAEFLGQFAGTHAPGVREAFADPSAPATFAACKLDARDRDSERGRHARALFTDLLRLRRDDTVLSGRTRRGIDAAVLGAHALLLRQFGADGDDRLLLVNLGGDFVRATIPEPLLAPPAARQWRVRWSSEDPRYGGSGAYPFDAAKGWRLAAHSALLLAAEPA